MSITYRALQQLQEGADASTAVTHLQVGVQPAAGRARGWLLATVPVAALVAALAWQLSDGERQAVAPAAVPVAAPTVPVPVMPGVAVVQAPSRPATAPGTAATPVVADERAPLLDEATRRTVAQARQALQAPERVTPVQATESLSGPAPAAAPQLAAVRQQSAPAPVLQARRPALSGNEIARLRARILQALQQGDTAQAGKDLARLQAALGEDSLFVRRLSAYYLMKSGQDLQALAAYEALLAEQQGDADSLLNAAILEMRLTRYEAALRRLERLASQPGYQDKAARLSQRVLQLMTDGGAS